MVYHFLKVDSKNFSQNANEYEGEKKNFRSTAERALRKKYFFRKFATH